MRVVMWGTSWRNRPSRPTLPAITPPMALTARRRSSRRRMSTSARETMAPAAAGAAALRRGRLPAGGEPAALPLELLVGRRPVRAMTHLHHDGDQQLHHLGHLLVQERGHLLALGEWCLQHQLIVHL